MESTYICPAAKTTLTFGIYKGESLQFILENHPAYLSWIIQNAHPELQQAAKATYKAASISKQHKLNEQRLNVSEAKIQLLSQLYDKRENIVAIFQHDVLSVLRIGSILYNKKLNTTIVVDTVIIPPFNSGRNEDLESYVVAPYYNIYVEGKELTYTKEAGKWELGNRLTNINLSVAIETDVTNGFYIMEELPKFIEVVNKETYDTVKATTHTKGILLNTLTNTVIAIFANTMKEVGAPCFKGYKVIRTQAYTSVTTKKTVTGWNSDWGYPPVNFIKVC